MHPTLERLETPRSGEACGGGHLLADGRGRERERNRLRNCGGGDQEEGNG